MRLPLPTHGVTGRLLFGVGARAYDALTAQVFWREQIARLVALAEPAGPVDVLDLGTGPGVSAFVLAAHMPAGSRVVGVDLSPQMIARARGHLASRRDLAPATDAVSFLVADATSLPFADASFDRVTGHSFLYLLPDAPAVLREVRRVLRPGGIAAFMEPAREGSLVRAATAALRRASPADLRGRRLGAAVRFSTSMALWRAVSATQGRFDAARARALFSDAGLEAVRTAPTLGGLGLHCVGRAPAAR